MSVRDSLDQGFHGRFGRPREVFFFAMPSMPPETDPGRIVVSVDRLQFPPLAEAVFAATELFSAGWGTPPPSSLETLAAFRLCFR
jgi:hypothetical protein